MSKLMIAGLAILLVFCIEEGIAMGPAIKVLRIKKSLFLKD